MTTALVHRPPTPEQLRRLERERDRCPDPEFTAVLDSYLAAIRTDPVPRVPACKREESWT